MFLLHMVSLLEFSCSMGLAALATRLMTTKQSCWWENDWAWGKKLYYYLEFTDTHTKKKRGCYISFKIVLFLFVFVMMVRTATIRSTCNLPGALAGKCRTQGPFTKFSALRQSRNSVTADFSESLYAVLHLEETALCLKILLHFAPSFGVSSCSVLYNGDHSFSLKHFQTILLSLVPPF